MEGPCRRDQRVRCPGVGGLLIHLVTYLSVNGMLVFIWLSTTGSTEQWDAVVEDPTTAVDNDFWPLLIALPWGVALVIHASTVLVGIVSPKRRRRRRRARRERHERHEASRERRREALRAAGIPVPPSGPVPPAPPAKTRSKKPVRQWTVVMFTDIARSTPLAETMGDEAWADAVVSHRKTVRKVLAAHHGEEVGTQGDGFLCKFDSPDGAVEAAVQLQRLLADQRSDGAFAPEIRVGLHAGEAIDGHDDLLGNAVNLAARVMGAAEPGEILVTEPVADHLRPGRVLEDRGLHELKGITRARHLLAVPWRDAEDAEVVDLRSS